MGAKNWIAKAIKKPGALGEAAKQRGVTTQELENQVSANPEEYSPLMRKRVNLAETLQKINKP